MPKCVRCNEFFPPNYTEVVDGSRPDPLNDGQYPQECIFCKKGVDVVRRESAPNAGDFNMEYSKKQCIEDYKAFIIKIKNAKDIMESKGKF